MTDLILTDEDGTPIKKDSVRRRILRNINIKTQYDIRKKDYRFKMHLCKKLGKEYGVSAGTIRDIIKGTNY